MDDIMLGLYDNDGDEDNEDNESQEESGIVGVNNQPKPKEKDNEKNNDNPENDIIIEDDEPITLTEQEELALEQYEAVQERRKATFTDEEHILIKNLKPLIQTLSVNVLAGCLTEKQLIDLKWFGHPYSMFNKVLGSKLCRYKIISYLKDFGRLDDIRYIGEISMVKWWVKQKDQYVRRAFHRLSRDYGENENLTEEEYNTKISNYYYSNVLTYRRYIKLDEYGGDKKATRIMCNIWIKGSEHINEEIPITDRKMVLKLRIDIKLYREANIHSSVDLVEKDVSYDNILSLLNDGWIEEAIYNKTDELKKYLK